jgi:fructan beta-fructosidase
MPVEGDPKNTRWVLHASFLLGENGGEGLGRCVMRHFVGDFDGTTFRPDDTNSALPTNFGPDDYAAITWADAPGNRRILLGWMSHWAYAGKVPTEDWKSLMTVPRELTLRADDENGALRLAQNPVPELRALRQTAARTWTGEAARSQTRRLSDQTGDTFEIEAQIEIGTAREAGLRLRVGDGRHTTVGYDVQTQTLFVDRTQSGQTDFHPHFAGRYQAPLPLRDGKLRLHLFADRCSLEVFAGDGRVVLNTLLFPDPKQQTLEFYADGGDASLADLILYPLQATLASATGRDAWRPYAPA